LTWLH
ncbi:hypothetical protein, partial [Achromobacter phage kwar_LB4]